MPLRLRLKDDSTNSSMPLVSMVGRSTSRSCTQRGEGRGEHAGRQAGVRVGRTLPPQLPRTCMMERFGRAASAAAAAAAAASSAASSSFFLAASAYGRGEGGGSWVRAVRSRSLAPPCAAPLPSPPHLPHLAPRRHLCEPLEAEELLVLLARLGSRLCRRVSASQGRTAFQCPPLPSPPPSPHQHE